MNRINKGQTIFEVIIALAIFALIGSSLVVALSGSVLSSDDGGKYMQAQALAEEAIEATRTISKRAWNELNLAQGKIATSSGMWVLQPLSGPEEVSEMRRLVSFSSVCRDVNNNISSCPAAYTDVHTKKATAVVTWDGQSATQETYLTNWDSQNSIQADWTCANNTLASVEQTREGLVLAPSISAGNWAVHSSGLTTRAINDVAFVPGTHTAWAVGNSGVIFYYNGSSWSFITSPVTTNINALKVVSADNAWAVGDGGRILHFNGTNWVLYADLGNQQWLDVDAVGTNMAWVVGTGGNAYSFNGISTTSLSAFGNTNISSISMLSISEGYAAGGSGKIFRWNGSVWSEVDLGSMTWKSIFMLGSCDGWAVGTGGNVYRWNGSSWNKNTSVTGSDTWNSIYMASQSNGWIVGNNGKIRRWNGSIWSSALTPVTRDLLSISTSRPTESSFEAFGVGTNGVFVRLSALATYPASGDAVSAPLNMDDPSPLQVISWKDDGPACSSCISQAQIKTAPDAGGSPGSWTTLWSGPDGNDGDETDFFTAQNGELIPPVFNGSVWARTKIILQGDSQKSPLIRNLTLNYR